METYQKFDMPGLEDCLVTWIKDVLPSRPEGDERGDALDLISYLRANLNHLDAMALEHVTRKRDKQLKGADAYNAVKLETMRQHYIRFCEDNPSARWKGVAPLAMMVSNYLAKQGIQDFGTETCRKLLKWVVGSLSAWDQTTASWRYEPLPGPAKRRGK